MAPPKRRKQQAYRKPRPKNVTLVTRGSVGFPEKGNAKANEQYMNSTHGMNKSMDANTKDNENLVTAAFEEAFEGFLKKGPFEGEQVQIYRHGVVIRPKLGQVTSEVYDNISELLKDIPGASAHIIKEDKTFSIRVNMGTSKKGVDYDRVVDNYNDFAPNLERIRRYVEDEYGDLDWFSFWDTEEAMYE
jgi:hypothetical protein